MSGQAECCTFAGVNVALLQVSPCFDAPGTPGEQWYFTAVFVGEPGKVQITQILKCLKRMTSRGADTSLCCCEV